MNIELKLSSNDLESLIKKWAEDSSPAYCAESIAVHSYGGATIRMENTENLDTPSGERG